MQENYKYKHSRVKKAMRIHHKKPMGCSNSSSKGDVYSNTSLHQETGNISNKQLNLAPKAIRERRAKKPQS